MNFPAEIGVSTEFQFPATVQGSGPISVSKSNGIWTIGYDLTRFPIRAPAPNDYILVWDSAHNVFALVALATITS